MRLDPTPGPKSNPPANRKSSPRPQPGEGAPSADPFHERQVLAPPLCMTLLGGEFEFLSDSAELRRIVDWAYAGLPRHVLGRPAPRFSVRLQLAGPETAAQRRGVPRLQMLSGGELLGAASARSDFVALSPASGRALVVVSRAMLRSPYHVRYDLLEFAVFTLAARAQGLVPLHAACAGRGGRGLLLIGDSGAGKSTAALHCLLAGLELLSEDAVFVTPGTLQATGVANFLHIKSHSLRYLDAATAARLAASPQIRRHSGARKLEIDLRSHGFQLAAKPLNIVGSVFLSPESAPDDALLSPLPRQELLRRLAATQPYAAQQPSWSGFRQALARLPAHELRRGRHPAQTARCLSALLAGVKAHGERSG